MADEAAKQVTPKAKPTTGPHQAGTAITGEEEHYEVVSEYRIGEGAPPMFLIVCFILIVLWAMFSWIPLFGY